MATGYTYILEEKPETTFAQFALRCARAFGACIDMRDHAMDVPPPNEVVPETYYLDGLREAEEEARNLEMMTVEVASSLNDEAYVAALEAWENCQAKYTRENETYRRMIDQVQAWKPPTPNHENMKKFMLEQLTGSLHTYFWEKPKKQTAAEYLHDRRTRAAEDVVYHAEHWKKAQASAREATEWLQALYASLPSSEEKP